MLNCRLNFMMIKCERLGVNSKATQLISLQTQYLYPIPVLSHVYIYIFKLVHE